MQLQDALYNWLSIKMVTQARPEDHAARDTYDFFDEILREDHRIEHVDIDRGDTMYHVHYRIDGETHAKQFPIELIDALLHSIEAEPRYNEQ